ncbi:MAG: hypothetical protein LBG05_09645 [Treponema sp.]|jgi:hypothetical protein|nr:hypothetical protein [Treponema sp.]
MKSKEKVIFLPFVILLLSADIGVPDNLRKPQKGEAPRYPKDIVIGELGRGEASEEAYVFAKKILSGILRGEKVADPGVVENIQSVAPQKFRIAGGREEDGSVSFIFRFIGREKWIVGEIYVRFESLQEITVVSDTEQTDSSVIKEAGWKLDDIILDDAKAVGQSAKTYTYDFSPYERFF